MMRSRFVAWAGSLVWGAIAFGMPPAIALGEAVSPVAVTPKGSRSAQQLALGRQAYAMGDLTAARQHWQQAARTAAATGDRLGQLQSTNLLVLVYQGLGDWEAARRAIASGQQLLAGGAVPALLQAQTQNAAANFLLATGDATAAIAAWQEAEASYKKASDRWGVLGSQLNRARAWQVLGDARRAEKILLATTEDLAADFPNSPLQLRGWQLLGSIQIARDKPQAARETLTMALALAEERKARSEWRSLQLLLASLDRAQGDLTAATARLDAVAAAENPKDVPADAVPLAVARLQDALARADWPALPGRVAALQDILTGLPPSPTRVDAALAMGANLLLAPPEGTTALAATVLERLERARTAAQALGDRRRTAQVLLLQGRWQSRQGQAAAARDSLQRTLQIAQELQAREIIAPAAWELGRLRATAGDRPAAIAAYQDAIAALQALRGDLATTSRAAQFSFRRTVDPVYRELVSLLLEDAPGQGELQQARTTIEALRLAELDNYFREACLDAQPVAIDSLDPQAAVIYPILLGDRLATIVSRANQPLEYYALPLPRPEVEGAVAKLMSLFHPAADNQERLQQSQTLYDWLVRPAEAEGWLEGVQTLVFVLDGNLRQLPIAALYDGDRYLIERYNIALSQGLQLLQPRDRNRNGDRNSLIAGLTEARGGFSPLPGVATELDRLESILSAARLTDGTFTKDRLERMVARRPIEILHLATHGQFGSRPEDTFLQAWDGPIDLPAIDELLLSRSTARTDAGLDLLVLSACETAAGDDLAILGLAGFAVRSGAQSTVATLWQVRDRSTARLMGHFYEALQEPTATKASALRSAQMRSIRDPQYGHPFFWAPFVLVGHWQ